MGKMPYFHGVELRIARHDARTEPTAPRARRDWRNQLPVLTGERVVLRELKASDAPALLAMLTSDEVSRFISPPPTTIEGFERFIEWARQERAAGTCVCYAVTVKGFDLAIGLFQIRELEPGFSTAEWGFALGSAYWGTGTFAESAELILEFIFDTLGAHRLEARAATNNGRGLGALRKVDAVQEGVLRRSFVRNGRFVDQALFSILDDDWRASRLVRTMANGSHRFLQVQIH